jgi:hypothetical protein
MSQYRCIAIITQAFHLRTFDTQLLYLFETDNIPPLDFRYFVYRFTFDLPPSPFPNYSLKKAALNHLHTLLQSPTLGIHHPPELILSKDEQDDLYDLLDTIKVESLLPPPETDPPLRPWLLCSDDNPYIYSDDLDIAAVIYPTHTSPLPYPPTQTDDPNPP